jgi:hypothetical protein
MLSRMPWLPSASGGRRRRSGGQFPGPAAGMTMDITNWLPDDIAGSLALPETVRSPGNNVASGHRNRKMTAHLTRRPPKAGRAALSLLLTRSGCRHCTVVAVRCGRAGLAWMGWTGSGCLGSRIRRGFRGRGGRRHPGVRRQTFECFRSSGGCRCRGHAWCRRWRGKDLRVGWLGRRPGMACDRSGHGRGLPGQAVMRFRRGSHSRCQRQAWCHSLRRESLRLAWPGRWLRMGCFGGGGFRGWHPERTARPPGGRRPRTGLPELGRLAPQRRITRRIAGAHPLTQCLRSSLAGVVGAGPFLSARNGGHQPVPDLHTFPLRVDCGTPREISVGADIPLDSDRDIRRRGCRQCSRCRLCWRRRHWWRDGGGCWDLRRAALAAVRRRCRGHLRLWRCRHGCRGGRGRGTAFRREIEESGEGEASHGTQQRKRHSGAAQAADLPGRQWFAEDGMPPAGSGSGQRFVCWLSHGLFSLSVHKAGSIIPAAWAEKPNLVFALMSCKKNSRRQRTQSVRQGFDGEAGNQGRRPGRLLGD